MKKFIGSLISGLKTPPGSSCPSNLIVFQPLVLFALCYLSWKFSPNTLTAILIISFTTTVPFMIQAVGLNILFLIAMLLRKIFPSIISKPICEAVKTFGVSVMLLHGKLIHGYEIHGKENLPRKTGSLVVYHHALVPYDTVYLLAEQYLLGGAPMDGVVNRELTVLLAGIAGLFNLWSDQNRVAERLKQGHHCTVAPGGAIEGTFSKNYELFWNGRVGFAKMAKQCKVPIVPMFTVNSQQSMPVTTFGCYDFFLDMYKRTKTYFYFPVFCFPAKMRIYLGEPLYCGSSETPAEFARRVGVAINELRDKHQRLPGNFILAILERFGYKTACKDGDYARKSS